MKSKITIFSSVPLLFIIALACLTMSCGGNNRNAPLPPQRSTYQTPQPANYNNFQERAPRMGYYASDRDVENAYRAGFRYGATSNYDLYDAYMYDEYDDFMGFTMGFRKARELKRKRNFLYADNMYRDYFYGNNGYQNYYRNTPYEQRRGMINRYVDSYSSRGNFNKLDRLRRDIDTRIVNRYNQALNTYQSQQRKVSNTKRQVKSVTTSKTKPKAKAGQRSTTSSFKKSSSGSSSSSSRTLSSTSSSRSYSSSSSSTSSTSSSSSSSSRKSSSWGSSSVSRSSSSSSTAGKRSGSSSRKKRR